MIKTQIQLSGLTCPACTKLTAKKIKQIPEVIDAIVNLESGVAEIVADKEVSTLEVAEVLKDTKYSVVV